MNLFVFWFCLFTSCLGFPELFQYESLSFIKFEKFWDIVFFSIFQKSTSNKLERVWRKGNPLALLVGMQTSTATMENSVEIP